MDVISLQQITIVIAFLAILIVVWMLISKKSGTLRGRLGGTKRMQVTEITTLGPQEKALIMQIDDREYLLIQSKKSAPMIMGLPGRMTQP